MRNITVCEDLKWIILSDKYTQIKEFKHKNVVIDYKGRQVQIVQKWQRPFSTSEKVKRAFLIALAVIAVVCTVGLVLLSKPLIKFFKKKGSADHYALPVPAGRLQVPQGSNLTEEELQRAQGELGGFIYIREDITIAIQREFEAILDGKSKGEIVSLGSNDNESVFTYKYSPGLIFEMKRDQNNQSEMKQRFQNLVHAKAVITKNNLNLLQLPSAKLFTIQVKGQSYDIIAHEKLEVYPCPEAQELFYEDHAHAINEAIRQLAVFTCITGYDHPLTWKDIPLYARDKLALINIKTMKSAEAGLFGTEQDDRCLVSCITEEQGKMVEEIAKERGINTERFQKVHEKRKAIIEQKNLKLKEFYADKNIVKGDEPIAIDESLLNFPQEEEKLKSLVIDLVSKINTKIAENSADSIKEKRRAFISPSPEGHLHFEQTVNKLIELGAIHRIIYRFQNEYRIQA